jgi:hypothetical protein
VLEGLSAKIELKILVGGRLLAQFRNGTRVCEDSTQASDRLRLQQTTYDNDCGMRVPPPSF